MALPAISGEFRLGADPDFRYAASGVAVCSLRAVASSRKKQDDGSWVDDKTTWVTLTAFKQMAENCAESLSKGDLVTVTGRLHVEEWEDKDGGKRITPKIILDSIGPALQFASAKVSKVARSEPGRANGQSNGGDPWTKPAANAGAATDDPPF